jgi:hypothetical protein
MFNQHDFRLKPATLFENSPRIQFVFASSGYCVWGVLKLTERPDAGFERHNHPIARLPNADLPCDKPFPLSSMVDETLSQGTTICAGHHYYPQSTAKKAP